MSTLILAALLVMALVPLLLRDTARVEERARYRRRTRPMRVAFQSMSAAVGAAMVPAMQKAVVAAADMQTTMQRIDAAMTSAGSRLAEEAERYANQGKP